MYADINGLRLYYEVHGEGRPVVLLHGGVLTIELMWTPWVDALVAAGRQVIAVELQGHGRTADVADRPMTIDNLADDVVGLLDAVGVEPGAADIVGFSLGGIVTYSMAVRHPSSVGRMVVISADYKARPDAPPHGAPLPTEADFAAMRAAYVAVAPDPGHFDAFIARTSRMVNEDFVGWTDDQLRAVPNPTLLIIGDNDFIQPSDAVEAKRLLPDAQLAVLPGTTHMDMTRRPAELLALVVPFLNR